MKWKILITAPYFQADLDLLAEAIAAAEIEMVVPPVSERLSEEELFPWVGDVDGAICGDDRFTERVLEAAPRLRVISKWGTGIDSIDRAACARRGVVVCNTPDAFSQAVADSVLGYALCFARGLLAMDRAIRCGRWEKSKGRALHECTFGVIGVGNVGKAVLRRVRAFGGRILGNDIVAMPHSFLVETGIEMTSKEELLRRSDFVSLNCDLNPTSHHLMDDAAFAEMRPSAFLINTARGPLVDEGALARALSAGRLAGAALDVFEAEPLPESSPLRGMENVLLAPHNANSSPAAYARVHESTLRNLIRGLEGGAR
jgi:D-3-phosphoglycerate dehydrogenase